MESMLQVEESLKLNKGYNEFMKKSFSFFENKTNNINREIESIKEFFKFLLSKGKHKFFYLISV